MAAAVVTNVESQIRNIALTKRIWPQQFFIDFDKLRSGFVTESQFARILWENLEVKLTDSQMESLRAKYDLKKDGRLNYRLFCDIINQPFDPNKMGLNPASQTVQSDEFLGSLRTLSPTSETRIYSLLRQLQRYYKYHGVNLKSSCEDFDWHHIGVIEESQFHRSFPHPPEVTENDVSILIQKYRDPDRPGLLNYLNLHHDLQAVEEKMTMGSITAGMESANLTNFMTGPKHPGADNTVQAIFDRIRIAVYKNGIRAIEFFKDYDKLRSGIITENQFVSSISNAVGKEAQLTAAEIQKLVEFYRMDDGRVAYQEICDMMANAFNIPDLEKKPLQTVIRPPEGALGRNLPGLTEAQETRVQEVLFHLSDQVSKRRLMMYQYFKDFDRSKCYSRIITKPQFGRILHFLGLDVAPTDFEILCQKFTDNATSDINYPAFVQCVDKEFVNYTQDLETNSNVRASGEPQPQAPLDLSSVDFNVLMARIRHHALINRRRVSEFFQDYDSLKSGYITKSQFRRGLSDFGLSSLGHHNLNEPQFEVLSQRYTDPNVPGKIKWTLFTADVDSVFTQCNLEKDPLHQVPEQELFLVPKPGTIDWKVTTPEAKAPVTQIMDRLRQRANQRRLLPKPTFQDFDKHNNGHVTRSQFRQCMTMLELPLLEDEMLALEAKFCNDFGFNYVVFLNELQPTEPLPMMYVKRQEEIRRTNMPKVNNIVQADLESILLKIKTMVFKDRVQILEWMRDYDKLRSGRISKNHFRRAMDLCRFELNESELSVLEDHYKQPGFPDFVDYVRFVDDMEAIFTTKHLDKAPLLDMDVFKPPVERERKALSPQNEQFLTQAIDSITHKVKKNRMQLFPLFEDFDKVHNGTVSRSQFRRVLTELELACLVPMEQQWKCLWERFSVQVGGRDDVNYIAFCEMIYKLADFEWRKP